MVDPLKTVNDENMNDKKRKNAHLVLVVTTLAAAKASVPDETLKGIQTYPATRSLGLCFPSPNREYGWSKHLTASRACRIREPKKSLGSSARQTIACNLLIRSSRWIAALAANLKLSHIARHFCQSHEGPEACRRWNSV